MPDVHHLAFLTDIQEADVFFLVDTTGSMAGELENLKTSISADVMSDVRAIVPDVWFGVGRFDDYPVDPYGWRTEVPFQLMQSMTGVNKTKVIVSENG